MGLWKIIWKSDYISCDSATVSDTTIRHSRLELSYSYLAKQVHIIANGYHIMSRGARVSLWLHGEGLWRGIREIQVKVSLEQWCAMRGASIVIFYLLLLARHISFSQRQRRVEAFFRNSQLCIVS